LPRISCFRRETQAFRSAHSSLALNLGLRHSASPLAVVSDGVPRVAGPLSGSAHNGRREFRFENKLLSLDAAVIDLCATLYDWAKFRRTKGAIKLHLLLDHDGYLPRFAVITDGKTHELKVARKLRWEPGTIVVFDRGYIDYQWFVELTRQGVFWGRG